MLNGIARADVSEVKKSILGAIIKAAKNVPALNAKIQEEKDVSNK